MGASSPNDFLVILRTGDLYVLTLETDQANMVRELRLTKAFGVKKTMDEKFCNIHLLVLIQKLQCLAVSRCVAAQIMCLSAPDWAIRNCSDFRQKNFFGGI